MSLNPHSKAISEIVRLLCSSRWHACCNHNFLINHVPMGMKGLIIAVIFAAAMSTLDSKINSISAVFVKDLYEPYITKKEGTPVRINIYVSILVGILTVGFVYVYLGDTTASILLVVGNLLAPFLGMGTATALCCFFFPSVNDKSMFYGGVLGAAVMLVASPYMQFFYLWTWVFSTIITLFLAFALALTIFKDPAERERTYQYTFFGARKLLKGVTDSNGDSVEPMKFDKYAAIMLVLFIIQVVALWLVQ